MADLHQSTTKHSHHEGEHEMTKRYTAADFANAKFAEHPSGSKAVRSGYPLPPWLIDSSGAPFVWQEDQEMADEGWVPVPTKPTITESRYRFMVEGMGFDFKAGFNDAL